MTTIRMETRHAPQISQNRKADPALIRDFDLFVYPGLSAYLPAASRTPAG